MRTFEPLTRSNVDAYLKVYVNVINKTSRQPRAIRDHVKSTVDNALREGTWIKIKDDVIVVKEGKSFVEKVKLIKE